jgi:hypothetical protein
VKEYWLGCDDELVVDDEFSDRPQGDDIYSVVSLRYLWFGVTFADTTKGLQSPRSEFGLRASTVM